MVATTRRQNVGAEMLNATIVGNKDTWLGYVVEKKVITRSPHRVEVGKGDLRELNNNLNGILARRIHTPYFQCRTHPGNLLLYLSC